MTIETRYVAALTDVAAIRLSCKKCGAAYSFHPTRALQPPHSCRVCNAVLFGDGTVLEREAFSKFQESVQGLLRLADAAPFKIELELPILRDGGSLTTQ